MVTNDNDSWWIGCEQNYTSLWQGLDLSQHLILIYMGHAKHNEFHMDRFIHPPYAVRTKNNLDHFLKKKKGGKLKFHLIRERKNNACVLCRVIDDLTREVIRTVKSPLTRLYNNSNSSSSSNDDVVYTAQSLVRPFITISLMWTCLLFWKRYYRTRNGKGLNSCLLRVMCSSTPPPRTHAWQLVNAAFASQISSYQDFDPKLHYERTRNYHFITIHTMAQQQAA